MKPTMSLLVSLALSAGLIAASITSAGAARTHAAGAIATDIPKFKFASGKFTGSVDADRRLCLQERSREPRTVTIYKKTDSGTEKVAEAELDFSAWATSDGARFSARHPGMDISKRKKRVKALNGSYTVKLDAFTKMEYSKNWTCAAASNSLTVKV